VVITIFSTLLLSVTPKTDLQGAATCNLVGL
jgi:hypothetical protein